MRGSRDISRGFIFNALVNMDTLFDLRAALQGAPICTVSGRRAVLCYVVPVVQGYEVTHPVIAMSFTDKESEGDHGLGMVHCYTVTGELEQGVSHVLDLRMADADYAARLDCGEYTPVRMQPFYYWHELQLDPAMLRAARKYGYTGQPYPSALAAWLRDKYGMFVVVTPDAYTTGVNWEVQVLSYNPEDSTCWDADMSSGVFGDNAEFATYEQAFLFGLSHAFRLLSAYRKVCMLPFDYNKALQGATLCTRDGRAVRVLSLTSRLLGADGVPTPIVVEEESADGSSDWDLFVYPESGRLRDWEETPYDLQLLVSAGE